MRRAAVFVTFLGLGFGLRCDGAPTARVCTIAPPAADWRLVTDGTVFRDSLGRVVLLRGVNAGGRSKFAPYVPFDFGGDYQGALDKYMDHAVTWGIDVMRVPWVWAALEPTQGQDDPVWQSRFDAFLDAAWARGIWTILDFHQDVYSECYCGDGFPSWTVANPPTPHHDCQLWSLEYESNPSVVAAFDAFWATGSQVQAAYFAAWDVMINRYKDRPGVLGWEPVNEVSGGSQVDDTFSATTLSAFYAQWVSHARSLAPNSLVFVEPSGTSGVTLMTTLVRPPGDGVVFAPHLYPLVTTPSGAFNNAQMLTSIGASWKTPTWVGEFGGSNQLSTTLPRMQATLDAFDALGMSGTEWEYSTSTDLWNFEQYGLTDSNGNDLPGAQAIIRPYARAVAGSQIASQYASASGIFTLTYSPAAGGVTDVSLPAGAYPSGYDVTLTGGCYDTTSDTGHLLVLPDGSATSVSLTISPK